MNHQYYTRVAAAIMNDYQNKIVELRTTLQDLQKETHLLLKPFDVSRVRHPIPENISSWKSINRLFAKELLHLVGKNVLGYLF
jgi:hypothetical protein